MKAVDLTLLVIPKMISSHQIILCLKGIDLTYCLLTPFETTHVSDADLTRLS